MPDSNEYFPAHWVREESKSRAEDSDAYRDRTFHFPNEIHDQNRSRRLFADQHVSTILLRSHLRRYRSAPVIRNNFHHSIAPLGAIDRKDVKKYQRSGK